MTNQGNRQRLTNQNCIDVLYNESYVYKIEE